MRNIFIFVFILLFFNNFLISQPLVLIDPGHGGNDPGAVGTCINEDSLNLIEALIT